MKVRIERECCTGDGLCEELCPDIFELQDDGLAPSTKQDGEVATDLEDGVLDAQAQCPGECTYVRERFRE